MNRETVIFYGAKLPKPLRRVLAVFMGTFEALSDWPAIRESYRSGKRRFWKLHKVIVRQEWPERYGIKPENN